MTLGPKPNSRIVGRAQGFYGFSSMEEPSLLTTMDLLFTNGKYNGSILGRNPVLSRYRELFLVGESVVFRLARGVATLQTTS